MNRIVAVDLQEMVPAQNLKKFVDVGSDRFEVHGICAADLIRDPGLVKSTVEQFQNSCAHKVQAENLAVMNIQEDATVLGVRPPDGFG